MRSLYQEPGSNAAGRLRTVHSNTEAVRGVLSRRLLGSLAKMLSE